MIIRSLIFFSIIFYQLTPLQAKELSESFQIVIENKRMRVISASKHKDDKFVVVIQNRTTSRVRGVVINQSSTKKNKQKFISVAPRSFESVDLKGKAKDILMFIPQFPTFQEALLKIGHYSYEIPREK